MKRKILLRGLIGAPIGVTISIIITIIISLLTGKGEYFCAPHELIDWCGSEITAVIIQLICSLIVGAIGGGSSVIWENEKWSLTKQTLVHFAIIVTTYIPISYILNWIPHQVVGAVCFSASFIIVYIIMWTIIYSSIRIKIKKLNLVLSQKESRDDRN